MSGILQSLFFHVHVWQYHPNFFASSICAVSNSLTHSFTNSLTLSENANIHARVLNFNDWRFMTKIYMIFITFKKVATPFWRWSVFFSWFSNILIEQAIDPWSCFTTNKLIQVDNLTNTFVLALKWIDILCFFRCSIKIL